MTRRLGEVPSRCRQRLTAHYGPAVEGWLDRVPGILESAARAWGLRLCGYHDAGHASALALAEADGHRRVMLKVWPDQDRYRRETAALRHWEPVNGQILRAQDDTHALACLELVGDAPGGCPRPVDDQERIAAALVRLHNHPAPDAGFPALDDYLHGTVEPRIRRRLRRQHTDVPHQVDLGVIDEPARSTGKAVLLHADLYRENVLFTRDWQPVFVDALPTLGEATFDWAFFTVYYDLARDPVRRLRLAADASGIEVGVLLPWCLLLCVDGLLYYNEIGDSRERRMGEVIVALAAECERK